MNGYIRIILNIEEQKMNIESLKIKSEHLRFFVDFHWVQHKDLLNQFHQRMNFYILAETMVIISLSVTLPIITDHYRLIIPALGIILAIIWLVEVIYRYKDELRINKDFVNGWNELTGDEGEITDVPIEWKTLGIPLFMNLLLPIVFIGFMAIITYYLSRITPIPT